MATVLTGVFDRVLSPLWLTTAAGALAASDANVANEMLSVPIRPLNEACRGCELECVDAVEGGRGMLAPVL